MREVHQTLKHVYTPLNVESEIYSLFNVESDTIAFQTNLQIMLKDDLQILMTITEPTHFSAIFW
jgi:hypothetical protein